MRILTVRQPWAWAIIHGGKDVENRPRNIAGKYRGPVAIHAGLSPAPLRSPETFRDRRIARTLGVADDLRRTYKFGAIVGVVELVDVHLDTDHEHDADLPSACRCRSEWAEIGAHHLVLADPRPLADPIPFNGALGLRRLDEDMTARILAAIA